VRPSLRSCASTRPLPVPRPPPSSPPAVASAPRSSALPCACSPTYTLPLSFVRNHIQFRAELGEQVSSKHMLEALWVWAAPTVPTFRSVGCDTTKDPLVAPWLPHSNQATKSPL